MFMDLHTSYKVTGGADNTDVCKPVDRYYLTNLDWPSVQSLPIAHGVPVEVDITICTMGPGRWRVVCGYSNQEKAGKNFKRALLNLSIKSHKSAP